MRSLTFAACVVLAAACSDHTLRTFRLPTSPTDTVAAPAPTPPPPPATPTYPGPTGPNYKPGTGSPVHPGTPLTFTIRQADVACYTDWDLTGRCQLFEFTPSVDGEMDVNVRRTIPTGADVMDLFVKSTAGDVVLAFDGWDWEQASLNVRAGERYGIFVMAYPPLPQEFTLTVDVR